MDRLTGDGKVKFGHDIATPDMSVWIWRRHDTRCLGANSSHLWIADGSLMNRR